MTLANFRDSSEKLKAALSGLSPDLEATLRNTKDFTATRARPALATDLADHQKYPEDEAGVVPVRKATRAKPRRTTP